MALKVTFLSSFIRAGWCKQDRLGRHSSSSPRVGVAGHRCLYDVFDFPEPTTGADWLASSPWSTLFLQKYHFSQQQLLLAPIIISLNNYYWHLLSFLSTTITGTYYHVSQQLLACIIISHNNYYLHIYYHQVLCIDTIYHPQLYTHLYCAGVVAVFSGDRI